MRQQSFATERLRKLHPIALARLTLARGFARLREQAKLFLQIEIASFPPAPQGRQVVAADNG